MPFTITANAVCPRCKYSGRFTSVMDADNDSEAIAKFKDSRRYCFSCSLFGIEAELNFDPRTQVDPHLSLVRNSDRAYSRTEEFTCAVDPLPYNSRPE